MSSSNGNHVERTRETATEAYARHLRHVSAMLGWIEDELEAHAERAKAAPHNWGLVGDLGELESLVKRALGHISGMDDSRIEQALNELEV